MFNTLLKTDFYKCCHMLQYDDSITHFTSYLTPRSSRFNTIDNMVFFGLSNFKDPKGCEGKKSLKGLCRVVKEDGEFKVIQNLTEEEYNAYQTHEMVNYFKDGKPVKYSFEDVRNRLEENI